MPQSYGEYPRFLSCKALLCCEGSGSFEFVLMPQRYGKDRGIVFDKAFNFDVLHVLNCHFVRALHATLSTQLNVALNHHG